MSLKIRRLGHRTELRPSWCVSLVEGQPCRDSRAEEATGSGAGRLGPGVPVTLAKEIRHPCAHTCVHACVCVRPLLPNVRPPPKGRNRCLGKSAWRHPYPHGLIMETGAGKEKTVTGVESRSIFLEQAGSRRKKLWIL